MTDPTPEQLAACATKMLEAFNQASCKAALEALGVTELDTLDYLATLPLSQLLKLSDGLPLDPWCLSAVVRWAYLRKWHFASAPNRRASIHERAIARLYHARRVKTGTTELREFPL
jgi:hypothetical protein